MALVVRVRHEHGEVVEAVLESLYEIGSHSAVQVEAHVGVALAKSAYAPCDEAHARALARADVNVPRHDVVAVREVRRCLVRQTHDLLCATTQVEALFGWSHAAAASLEQFAAELALE